MFGIKLALVVFSLALAKAQVTTNTYTKGPERAAAPSVCNDKMTVWDGEYDIEKTLCFIKVDRNGTRSDTYCRSKGMQLYVPKSTPASWDSLLKFGRDVLKGNPKAEVYVAGRASGNRCQVFNGDGTLEFIHCGITSYSLCEYYEVTTYITCENYYDSYSNPDYNTDGMTTPKDCSYKSAITSPKTVIATNAANPKNTIAILDLNYRKTIAFLPVDIAINFPELRSLQAEYCSIKYLSKRSLHGLHKLTYLALDYNFITKLDAFVFRDIPLLVRLDFENPMVSITKDFFVVTLPNLKTVWLDPAGCIDTFVYEDRAAVALLPGSVTNTCLIV